MEITKLKPGVSIVRQSNDPMTVLGKTAQFEFAMISRKHPHREKGNEDCLAIINLGAKGLVVAVADGAGGYPQADAASRAACEALTEQLLEQYQASAKDDPNGLREWVPGAIVRASKRVKELAPLGRTTLTVGALSEGQLRSYQVGDSELLVTGQKGKVKHRTQSHSPVGYAVATGELNEKEALHHPDRHLVSNFLGDDDWRVEMSTPVLLGENDSVLLGSDGLFDNFLAEELIESVRKGTLEQRAQALALKIDENFSDRGEVALKFDDVSAVIVKTI